MQQDTSRNTILFIVFALVILVAYQFFVLEPAAKRRQADLKSQSAVAGQSQPSAPDVPAASAAPQPLTRDQAKGATPRIAVDTPALAGSLTLKGARIDDLYLKNFRETEDKDSPPVELFRPEGAKQAWFAEFGWTGDNLPGLPTSNTIWQVKEGGPLSPGHPIVLTHSTPQGLVFTRKVSVDDHYLFTIEDTVANTGAQAVTLAPYASVQRQGLPEAHGGSQIVHEGAIGVFDGNLSLKKYKAWKKDKTVSEASTGGWLGITDKYWLAAVIPQQSEKITGAFRVTTDRGVDIYDSSYVGQPRAIPPGRQVTETTRLFAGAKVVPLLKRYQDDENIPRLDDAVDWGRLFFFTRPFFWVLEQLYHLVGNFGLAILGLTVLVKIVFFPLANKSYESITKMKKVQPRMEELKAKYKDDPPKLQQEMMQLYQREKINPLSGCLPILIQIPVFFSLYKVLSVTIEMRHAPFFGWIHDLSSRDPTTIWNLFGAIPWDPATAPMIGGLLNGSLHIGVWPLIMGFTMWLQQAMNPPAPDPMQQKIFQFFPIVFTFMLAPFAAGLVIYWSWNNLLSILQQYVIMRRFGVDNPIDKVLGRFRSKPA
ncbi:MAG TPA: membrane protein insertase YidC [Caulobacteraceae bacterium]